jgi:hypothetical protein
MPCFSRKDRASHPLRKVTAAAFEGLYGAAGTAVLADNEAHQDSFNQMGALLGENAPPRRMILHNLDDCTGDGAIASGQSPGCASFWGWGLPRRWFGVPAPRLDRRRPP